MKTENGNIIIPIDDIVRDEAVVREIAKQALFDDFLLHAISNVALKGEVQWTEEEAPWWTCSSGSNARFEKVRALIATVAEEGTKALIVELTGLRDRLEKEKQIYQTRAWRAEWTVQRFKAQLIALSGDDEFQRKDIQRICQVSAHASPKDVE